jgi:hypothetical protein
VRDRQTRKHLLTSSEFDKQALFTTMDARRQQEELSWAALSRVIWERSRVLNERRKDHPISPATLVVVRVAQCRNGGPLALRRGTGLALSRPH